jgi:hypothetical protein
MLILGINAHHADAAACIVADGKLLAAAEEERFRRIKHWAGFPSAAIDYCLREAGVGINDVDHIAVNRDPNARLMQRMKFILARRPSVEAIRRRLANRAKIKDLRTEIVDTFNLASLKPKLHNVEHHRAHLASAAFVSPVSDPGVLDVPVDREIDHVAARPRRPCDPAQRPPFVAAPEPEVEHDVRAQVQRLQAHGDQSALQDVTPVMGRRLAEQGDHPLVRGQPQSVPG